MLFRVKRTSDFDERQDKQPCSKAVYNKEKNFWVLEIENLEDLIILLKEVDCSIILSENDLSGADYTIEIYDDWRE